MRRSSLCALATAAAVGVATAAACDGRERPDAAAPVSDPAAARPAREKRATPIILVTVDTLRPDHLPVYGYDEQTAPAISRLAESSVVFDLAFTTAPKTAPAYATMFTGVYPYRHGLRLLGQELHADNRTLAELLAAAGYATAGFVSSTVMIDRLSGLGQGFAAWDDHMPVRELHRANYERGARQTIDAVLDWLPKDDSAFFLFIHLIDPHGPYLPPPMFRVRFDKRQGRSLDPEEVPEFQRLPGATVIGDYVDGYDGEVSYADFEIARLFGELVGRGLYKPALIVFTADHGESFGEDGFFFRHGKTLHEVSIRVPLVIKPPGGRRPGVPERHGGSVSLLDVMPTLLDYAGVEVPGGLDGVSLRARIEGGDPPPERFVFSERWLRGRRNWAIHSERGTLRAEGCRDEVGSVMDRCRETYMGRLSSGRLIEIDQETDKRVELRARLEAFATRAAGHELPFDVLWRYRPKDKEFVEQFIAEHNLRAESYSQQDADALERLGYLDD